MRLLGSKFMRLSLAVVGAAMFSGCYVTARTPGNCVERVRYDSYGNPYYETVCYRNGAYYPGPVRYPARRPGGVIVTPPPRHVPGRVIVRPPRRGGGVIVTPPGHDRGRGRRPGRGYPRGASVIMNETALQHLALMGPAFEGASVERRVDPSLEAGKIMIEAQLVGESEAAVNDYLDRIENLGLLHVATGQATVGSTSDACAINSTAEGIVNVEGVCVESIRIITPNDTVTGPSAELNGQSV